jgi:hypothetical protein
MPLDLVRMPEATATREPDSVPVAQTAGEPFLLIDERDGRTVVSGAPTCTLGRATPLREGRPDGIFARWAWDGRQLQLENDRYGLQPLYYFSDKGRFALSPSVSKLIELGAPSDLDFEALAVFLHLGYFLGDETPFRAIRAVPPNASCRWSQGALTVEGRRPRLAAVRIGRDEALAAYVASFREAIRRRPPESDDVVHLLSGGRDSRHILFELQHNGHPPRTCLTVAYAGGDAAVARVVAEALGIEHGRFPVESRRRHGASQERAHELLRRRAHVVLQPRTTRATADDALRRARRDVLSAGLFPRPSACGSRGRPLPDLARDISVGSVVNRCSVDMRERLANAAPLARIAQALESMGGEPNPVSAFFFWNRTRREIALGPYRMLCNNAVVHSPYVDAGVYDLLMGMPAATFVDHTFHTDAINLAFPQHRHLPYAGKTPDGTLSWRQSARMVLDLLGSSFAPGNHIVGKGFPRSPAVAGARRSDVPAGAAPACAAHDLSRAARRASGPDSRPAPRVEQLRARTDRSRTPGRSRAAHCTSADDTARQELRRTQGHPGIAQHAVVAEAPRLHERLARPGRYDRGGVGDCDLEVVAVVDEQERRLEALRQHGHVQLPPGHPDAALASTPQLVDDVGRQPEAGGEALHPARRLGGGGEQDDASDAQSVAQRERDGRGPERVGDDTVQAADRLGEGLQRLGELRSGRAPAARASVARRVERNHREAARHERLHERRELSRAPAPAVKQGDGRAAAPAPRRHPTPGHDHPDRLWRPATGRDRSERRGGGGVKNIHSATIAASEGAVRTRKRRIERSAASRTFVLKSGRFRPGLRCRVMASGVLD